MDTINLEDTLKFFGELNQRIYGVNPYKKTCIGCGDENTTRCDNTMCEDCWSRENE